PRLVEQVKQEHRIGAKAQKAPRPKPFVYQLPKRSGRKRPSRSADSEGKVFRLPPTPSHRKQSAEEDEFTDAFLFVRGEPAIPFVTKVGGVPYRAAEVPWPAGEDGRPMTFLAQFCFSGSTDLVGELPGDVLLVFARDDQAYFSSIFGDDDGLRFEWYPLGLQDFCAPSQVPDTPWKLLPCTGVAQRTSESRGSF